MERYVNADKLIEFANNHKDKRIDANDIARFPRADVAEVVRCKDCKYARGNLISVGIIDCLMYRDIRKGEDFCNHGERKAQE